MIPEKSSNPFSILHISDRRKVFLKQAVICLTVTPNRPDYSSHQGQRTRHGSMSNNFSEDDSPLSALTSESARQRWKMFHRAIALAKQSNNAALQDAEPAASNPEPSGPLLSIAR
jgi:hypothetical protein